MGSTPAKRLSPIRKQQQQQQRSSSHHKTRSSAARHHHHNLNKPTTKTTTTLSSSSVSEKLEALKNLVPAQEIDTAVTPSDQLFKETADYILLLRTQVSILQKLVDFYASPVQQ